MLAKLRNLVTLSPVTRRWLRDVIERTLWTAAQAGVGVLAAAATDLPIWAAVPIAAALASAKGWIARHVGDSDSAATLRSDTGQANVLASAVYGAVLVAVFVAGLLGIMLT